MSVKIFILLVVINSLMSSEIKDTDCYKSHGSSIKDCKQFTTFVNDTDEYKIEKNVLYLCCYKEGEGCVPLREDVIFAAGNENLIKSCISDFLKEKYIYQLLSLLIAFL